MSVLLLPPIFQFFDDNGDPLAGGFVDTFAAGTTTRLATYTDYTGTIEAPNPIELDAAGRPTSGSGAIWGQGAYKFIVRDANGVQVGDPLDNVTSFTALASATNAFFQSFSGNGSQTVFTTSDDLGTEEKALMVFVSKGLEEIAVNGSFTSDTGWTKGAGWTIAAGVATATGAISTALSQVPTISLVVGQAYAVTYTVTRSAGGLIPSLGGQSGVERTASGTYREIIIAASTTPIAFTGNAFTGTLDNVSITRADAQGYDILSPSAFTINGTSLTFASAPATGTNNIYVFAPSLLLGAASSAAALAQTYAAQSLASAADAAASAAQAAVSIKWRPLAACATTANITLSGEQTIDGVLTSSSIVVVKDQVSPPENGVYVSGVGAWTRATDADTWDELVGQSRTINAGTVNAKKSFGNTNSSGGTIGVTDVTWTEIFFYPAPNSVSSASLTTALASSLILTVKRQSFTGNGTYTPSTGMVYCDIEAWGGGGGGGGAQSGFVGSTGGGGGAGGYAKKVSTAASIGASQTVTIGAGGAGNSAATGSAGASTSVGAICVAAGGSGGATSGAAANPSSGGSGGAGVTGDVLATGNAGNPGIGVNGSSNIPLGGAGGASSMGGVAAVTVLNGDTAGAAAAANSGSGGNGASSKSTAQIGGAGGSGYVIITEYCSQ